ncbi:MAG: hypothetical protein B7X56_06360 [Burkholderiales bacterium 34-67-9]|nr:MAG: hypothetical protein B7X56_06360 [Burkholderiales bacterium 34-67-9]
MVLLPEPVEPTTSIRPRLAMIIFASTGGSCSDSKAGISLLMKRTTMAQLPRCFMALRRKRPTPASGMAMLSSPLA